MDALQETFLSYSKSINTFKGECSIKTWLLVITRNYCYKKISRKKNFATEFAVDEEQSYEIKFDENISLKDALKQLSPENYELVYLRDFEGYSYKEIAEILQISIENVKIKLFRIRKTLRNLLED